MDYLRNWRNYSTTIVPICYSGTSSRWPPCSSHALHIRYLPHWLVRWFLRTFVVSTCVRIGGA